MAKRPPSLSPPPAMDDDIESPAVDDVDEQEEAASTAAASADAVLRDVRSMAAANQQGANPIAQYECGIYPELVSDKARLAKWLAEHEPRFQIKRRKLHSDSEEIEAMYQRYVHAARRAGQFPAVKQVFLSALTLMSLKVPLDPPPPVDVTSALDGVARRLELANATKRK